MSEYHEPSDELSSEARDFHRALTSLKEEIEAVDWYHQRVECTASPGLKAILAHNRDEEIEHAVMTLEWLRRNMPAWDEQMRKILFTEGPIVGAEHGGDDDDGGGGTEASGLGIGSRKETPK